MKKLLLGAILLFSVISCSTDEAQTEVATVVVPSSVETKIPENITDNVYTRNGIKMNIVSYFDNSLGDNIYGYITESDFTSITNYVHYDKELNKIYIYKFEGKNAVLKQFNIAGSVKRFDDNIKEVLVFNFDYSVSPFKSIRIEQEKKSGGKCTVILYQRSETDSMKRFYSTLDSVNFDFETFLNGKKV